MGAPTVYRWDDANAPVVNGVFGGDYTILNLLKACLVDGYGDKAAAGWDMPYVNDTGTIGVFRNYQGNGHYLQVDGESYGSAYGTYFCPAEEFTSYSDGTLCYKEGGSVSSGSVTNCYAIRTAVTAGSTNTFPWCIIANEKFFIFFLMWNNNTATYTSDTTYWEFFTLITFGDFNKLWDTDEYNTSFTYGVNEYRATYTGLTHGYEAYVVTNTSALGSSYAVAARNLEGDTREVSINYIPGVCGGIPYDTLGGIGPYYVENEPIVTAKPVLLKYSDQMVVRGTLPGWNIANLHRSSVTQFQEITDGEKTYVAIKMMGYYRTSDVASATNSGWTQIGMLAIEIGGTEWD
jgi:hypothetical protein